MSGGLASEVAEDYKASLEDLVTNTRWEINNLTVIARENTEHAVAISKVLENHIRTTNSDRKLPALYVLDSIVKNVGTPYTIILGKTLYNTFMDAYSLVNAGVRKKLDEMLVTWKQPVPGSLDSRPVFPAEIIRPIENALIKWRTMHVQMQQKSQQDLFRAGRPMGAPLGNTPTPPQNYNRYQQPPMHNYPAQPMVNGHAQPQHLYQGHPQHSPSPHGPAAIQQQYPPPSQAQYPGQPVYQAPAQQSPALEALFRDIDNLIHYYKTSFATNVGDSDTRTKLQALLQLQTILRTQHVPNVEEIRAQLAQIAVVPSSVYVQGPYAPTPPPAPAPYVPPMSPSTYAPPPTPSHYSPPPATSGLPLPLNVPQPEISNLLGSNALADLLASVQAQQPAPPPAIVQSPLPPPSSEYSPPPPAHVATPQPSSLIASLRAAGVLPPQGDSPVNGAVTQPAPSHYSNTQDSTKPAGIAVPPPAQPIIAAPINDVELTSASLKIPRPHLIASLYDAFPNQCSTCGKRFLSTPEGKKKKERHLDWHFRIRIKREDAAKRGQSRSWYVSELEWIRWQETTEEGEDAVPNGAKGSPAQAAAAAEAAQRDPKNQYILVPDDHALANAPCPICQEPFQKSYDDSIGDWVWKDAVKVGSRVYHASEYVELKSEGGNTPLRTSTPDSVLGKRKGGGTDESSNTSRLKVL